MKKHRNSEVRKQMEKLEPIDLSQCHTVSDIVSAMSRCAFGARMLGEVAETLTSWFRQKSKPTVIYDGEEHSTADMVLRWMRTHGLIRFIIPSVEYVREH